LGLRLACFGLFVSAKVTETAVVMLTRRVGNGAALCLDARAKSPDAVADAEKHEQAILPTLHFAWTE
jgi:hypothetical protein